MVEDLGGGGRGWSGGLVVRGEVLEGIVGGSLVWARGEGGFAAGGSCWRGDRGGLMGWVRSIFSRDGLTDEKVLFCLG